MTGDPVPLFVNARAGRGGEDLVREIREALDAANTAADIRFTDPRDLADELAAARAGGAPMVAVSGGDGTLLTAADALAGSETALAAVPTGTLNHFARRLGIETVEDAAAAIATGRVARAPLGVVDDTVFLNTATFGLYADVVRRREAMRRWLGKWPAAVIAFAGRTLRLRQLDLVLEVEGRRLHRRTPLLWIGMGRGSFPFVHESDERRSSPELEIVVIRATRRLGVLRLLGRLSLAIRARSIPLADPGLEVLHARWVLIRARHPGVGVTLDGEIFRLTTPIFVGVADGALRVRLQS